MSVICHFVIITSTQGRGGSGSRSSKTRCIQLGRWADSAAIATGDTVKRVEQGRT
jgi:hypothetical protein